jgi:hypothetical protein
MEFMFYWGIVMAQLAIQRLNIIFMRKLIGIEADMTRYTREVIVRGTL